MMYRPEGVGSAYRWAPSDARAVQIDDVTKTPGIMFVAAMSTTEVLPITMAVPQPVTVTGELFEWWVEHFLIPDMIAKGKRVLVLDNARPHRKNVLRALLAAAGGGASARGAAPAQARCHIPHMARLIAGGEGAAAPAEDWAVLTHRPTGCRGNDRPRLAN